MTLTNFFQGQIFQTLRYRKHGELAQNERKNTNSIYFDICYRMESLRKLYSVALTYIFKVKSANSDTAAPQDLPPFFVRHRFDLFLKDRGITQLFHPMQLTLLKRSL